MTHTTANRFKRLNQSHLAKTSTDKPGNDYLKGITVTYFPKVSAGKLNLEKISASDSGQKIFSKSAMGYTGEGSIDVHDQEVDQKKNPF
jgi:hypothetical protein